MLKFANTIIFLVALTLVLPACSGNRPKTKTAQSVAHSHLKKYGRKYKTAPFSKSTIDKVVVNQIEPVSHNVANTDAIVHLNDGRVARTVFKMEKRFPGGWRVTSWEILAVR